ncbi:MAG: GTPase Era [Pseudomonadota bacterium]
MRLRKHSDSIHEGFLSSFIAITGPPNVGKSTLLNRLLGEKVAIVSPKPQTTRNRVVGIYHGDGYQMVFMDTPGIHRTRTALHKSMVESAKAAFFEVDLVMVMIEMPCPYDPNISLILENLENLRKPSLLAINKIDTGSKETLLPIIDDYQKRYSFEAIVPISATRGDGIDRLLEVLSSSLKPGPEFFPKDMKTDQSESFMVSEIIREKIFLFIRREVPYSSAVTVDGIHEVPGKDLITISAKIHVESDSQKGILIGEKGKMIKRIGQSSRLELEKVFGTKVFLDLFVHVDRDWSKDPKSLRRLGY